MSMSQGAETDIEIEAAHYRALAAFRFAVRTFLDFSQKAAHREGLTPQQHQALLAIKGTTPSEVSSVGELAERLLIRHHSAVELSGRLARAGLVARDPDPNDGRRVLLRVTPSGEDRLRRLAAIHLQELRAVRPALQSLLTLMETDVPPG